MPRSCLRKGRHAGFDPQAYAERRVVDRSFDGCAIGGETRRCSRGRAAASLPPGHRNPGSHPRGPDLQSRPDPAQGFVAPEAAERVEPNLVRQIKEPLL
eukprot:5492492-Prorocentrum_lima.AAC.1